MPNLRLLSTRLPLRYSAPIAVLGLALLLGVSALLFNLRLSTRQVERAAVSSLQREAASLQRSLEYLLAHDDLNEVQQQMAQKGADPRIETVFVADERGIITAAGDRSDLGRTLAWRLSLLHKADPTFDPAAALKEVGTRGGVWLSPSGHWAIAIYPVRINQAPVIEAPGRTTAGFMRTLVVVRGLATYKALAHTEVLRGFISYAVLSVVCAAALAWLMYRTVTRRAMQLTRAAGRFAAGDVEARAELSGEDELALAGRAFDAMAVQVGASQRDLVESEARFRRLADAAPVMIWVAGPDGYCTYVNEAWVKFRGRPFEKELGAGWIEGVPPEDMERDLDIYSGLVNNPKPLTQEYRLIRHDGEIRLIESETVPRYSADGRCIGFIGAGTDITERRAAEIALRESREQLSEILSTALDSVIAVDEQYHITLFNRAAGIMFQRSAEEVLGGPLDALLPERFRASHGDHVRRFGATDITRRAMGVPGMIFGLRANGEEFPIEASISQALVGTRRFYTVIVRDISERVVAEMQRTRLEEQLRQAQKMEAVGTLAGGIAHDFNNIMAAILGNADLARQDLPTTHAVQTSIAEITAATRRGKEMVSRLLAFSRPQAPQRQQLALRPIAEEALRLLRSTLPAGVEIELSAAGEIPLIEADAAQIHQVLLNLITNAWHAMDADRGRIHVHLTARKVDSALSQRHPDLHMGTYACLAVHDNGRGMDAATRARIFEPFFTTKGPGAGTGLGLSVVHGIMRGHAGAVLVDSSPGQGATFHLYFPAASERVTNASNRIEKMPQPLHGRGQHILYVDDEEPLVFLAERSLQRLGYRVTGCTQATQAIRLFRADPSGFDLVVTDFNMPGMSGLELARELLTIRPDAVVVLASGYFRAQDEQSARALGVRAVLLKPSTVEEAAALIADVLGPANETASASAAE